MSTRGLRATSWRLFVTVWVVCALHATTNVVRETYLALALGEDFSIRVDKYIGLHDDLFEMPGRGAYINSNPGASMVGAIPVLVTRPVLGVLFRLAPGLVAPKPAATYDDPRPNRNIFLNRARERGLDIKLGLIALITQFLLMAPMAAAGTVVMFHLLFHRLGQARTAAGLALLYTFATPIFFRTGFLNHNVLVAHYLLLAWCCIAGIRPRPDTEAVPARNLAAAGGLLGLSVLTDYSGVPMLLVFMAWITTRAWRLGGARRAGRDLWWTALGGLPSLVLLLTYQQAAFGNPFLPAQSYMPPTPFSVRGWNGFTWPTPEFLVGTLVDPRYGLLAFSPFLLLAVAAFRRWETDVVPRDQLRWMAAMGVALYVYSSASQFNHLQWNTGVRYMLPAVPFLFLMAIPALRGVPPWVRASLVGASLVVSWVVSMTRESVTQGLLQVFTTGLELPILTILQKTASGYLPALAGGVDPLPIFLVVGAALWMTWRGYRFEGETDAT